jgi:lycopene cyclase CruP
VIQFQPLLQTMAAQVVAEPDFVPKLMGHVGLVPLMGWLGHVAALGAYTALDAAAAPTLGTIAKGMDKSSRYKVHRWLDAWKYGSGRDFKL